MKMFMKTNLWALPPTLCALLLLSGCDQVRQTVGDLINPPNASEITVRVDALAAQGKVPQAIQLGEDFLLKNKDPNGDLHRKLAQLHTSQGDTVSAVRHLQQSTLGAAKDAGAQPQADKPRQKPAEPTAQAGPAVEVGGAAAKVGPDGIEVRAGDVTVKISK